MSQGALLRDIRFGLRTASKDKGSTAVAIVRQLRSGGGSSRPYFRIRT